MLFHTSLDMLRCFAVIFLIIILTKLKAKTRALFKYCAEARQGKANQGKAQIVEILAYVTCHLNLSIFLAIQILH